MRRSALALLLLVPVPSLGVMAAMLFEPTRGTPLGQGLYAAAKVWMIAMPLLWRVLVERAPLSLSPARHGGLGMGLLTGLLIAAAIIAGYLLVGRSLIDLDSFRAAAGRNGIGEPGPYLLLAGSLTLFNSLAEEFVWRWFVFRQSERLLGARIAIIASAAMFTLHHVLALMTQTSWDVTLLASVGLFIGACTWSWLYQRYRSIWPGWLSHVLADIAVFAVGWYILFGW